MKPALHRGWKQYAFTLFSVTSLLIMSTLLRAQENDSPAPETPTGPPVSVTGTVLNAATGKPLPRALVKLTSESPLGALTDGDGRFEIPAVLQGLQSFQVTKPGFHSPGETRESPLNGVQLVQVASAMPALEFSLAPDNAISGQVTLSTGIPAQTVGLWLLEQIIESGRPVWKQSLSNVATPDGEIRFHGLRDGYYSFVSRPELENMNMNSIGCDSKSPPALKGYAPTFYGGADALAGADRIQAKGGQNTGFNFALTLTTYHLVLISIASAPTNGNWAYEHTLYDHNGLAKDYPYHEEKGQSLCMYLPDGAYTLWETTLNDDASPDASGAELAARAASNARIGLLEFSVEGHAERNLRLSLTSGALTPVHLSYQPRPPKPKARPAAAADAESELSREDDDGEPLGQISATRLNAISGPDSPELSAAQVDEHTYAFPPTPPGEYWISAESGADGQCIGQVTAAGQDLANSPWTVGSGGTGTPIDIVLRTDCASLTLQIPESLPENATGEGANLYVYAVPQFPSVVAVNAIPLQQFGNRTRKLEDMTPGPYIVYTFRSPHSLNYRNSAALDQFGAGQQITLEPGSEATLVVQEASQ